MFPYAELSSRPIFLHHFSQADGQMVERGPVIFSFKQNLLISVQLHKHPFPCISENTGKVAPRLLALSSRLLDSWRLS